VELNFYVNTGKAVCTATWNLGINPAFPSKPSKLHVGVYIYIQFQLHREHSLAP